MDDAHGWDAWDAHGWWMMRMDEMHEMRMDDGWCAWMRCMDECMDAHVWDACSGLLKSIGNGLGKLPPLLIQIVTLNLGVMRYSIRLKWWGIFVRPFLKCLVSHHLTNTEKYIGAAPPHKQHIGAKPPHKQYVGATPPHRHWVKPVHEHRATPPHRHGEICRSHKCNCTCLQLYSYM